MSSIDLFSLFGDQHVFEEGHIGTKEFEQLIRDTVSQEHPLDPIVKFDYEAGGVVIVLESGETIEIQVDWQEFILV